MKLTEVLKGINRTVLEMHMGILFCGIICQAAGAFFVKEQSHYALSLWFGIALALASVVHMYRTLDRALDFDEKSATRIIFTGYITRYVLLIAFLIIISITGVMNPLIVFMAYMSLKVTALIQPFTHKLCNKLFNETDPIPEAMPEEVSDEGEAPSVTMKEREVKI